MQNSRYSSTNINNEYLIYPFNSPINYNFNYSGTFSKFGLVDKFYLDSLIKNNKRLISGGAEWSDTGMTFSLSDIWYSFSGEILSYTNKYPNLSFSTPDSTNPRIDSIIINEDGVIKIKSGTPSATPVLPEINEDEILIQHAYVLPGTIKNGKEPIYYNDTHWLSSGYLISGTLSGTYSFTSTSIPYGAPYGGTLPDKSVEVNSDYKLGIRFTKGVGSINSLEYGSLTFKIRFESQLPSNRSLIAQISGTSSSVSGTVSTSTLNLMSYGVDREVYGKWQHIVIPLTKFGTKVQSIKSITFRLIGGSKGDNFIYRLDDIYLQRGYPYIDEFYNSVNYLTGGGFSSGGGGGIPGLPGSGGSTPITNITTNPNTGIYITTSTSTIINTTYNTALDSSLTMQSNVGGILATSVSNLQGKTFVQLFDDLLFPTANPTYTIPTLTLSGSSQTVEIGTSVTPTLTLNAIKNDAGVFTQLRLERSMNGSTPTPLTSNNTLTPSAASDVPAQFSYPSPNNPNYSYSISYSQPSLVVPTPPSGNTTTITYTGYGDYSAGLAKKNNKGVTHSASVAVRNTSLPQAGSTNFSSNTVTITGIFPYFYGKSSTSQTSAQIKSVIEAGTATKVVSSAAGTLSINFNANGEWPWFAIQLSYNNKTSWFVNALNSGSIGNVGNLFGTPDTLSITLTSGVTTTYKIYKTSLVTTLPTTTIS